MRKLLVFLIFSAPTLAQNILAPTNNTPFNPGEGPFYSVTADFNLDGNLDVAFADEGNSGSLHVLLGDGHGGFTPGPGGGSTGAQPAGILVADFNGDGIPDIAGLSTVSYPLGGSVVISLGDGKGGFSQIINGPSIPEYSLTSFGIGDFNGDGIPDVAVSSPTALVILYGDGKGNLVRGASPSGSGAILGHIAVGNFTDHGHSDIAVANAQGLTIFVCDGKGGFTALPTQPFPYYAGGVGGLLSADFNNDGFPDLFILGVVLLNDGSGNFKAAPTSSFQSVDTRYFAVADFNGDGILDLASCSGNAFSILLGDGNGVFKASQSFITGSSNNVFSTITTAGDFNNDGKPDLVAAVSTNSTSDQGFTYLNVLPSIVVSPKAFFFHASQGQSASPQAFSISPVNEVPSISQNQLWFSVSNNQITVNTAGLSPGTYKGAFGVTAVGYFGALVNVVLTVAAPAGKLAQGPTSTIAGSLTPGDINGDGITDLLVNNSGVLTVWFGDGTGNFTVSGTQTTLPPSTTYALGDFNLDGHLDIVVCALNNTGPVQVWFGNGAGTFAQGPSSPSAVTPYFNNAPPTVADFNLDGIPDIFVAGYLYLGDGTGRFHQVLRNADPQQLEATAVVADFNRDGLPDIAYTTLASSFVYIFLGDGKGGLTLSQRYDFSIGDPAVGKLALGDFNNDGIPDLAVASTQHAGLVEILDGNGDGTFRRANGVEIPGTGFGTAFFVADFDGDGNQDIALSPAQTNNFTVFLGDGRGNFTPSPGGSFPSAWQFVADFNRDGRPDVAIPGSVLLGGLANPVVSLTQLPPNPFDVGEFIQVEAAVSPDPRGFRAPTGKVSLFDGVTPINGYSVFTPGTHQFSAVYPGDPRNATAKTTLTIIENGPPAVITALGNSFPLRAQVFDSNNNPIPGVRVTFAAPVSGPSGLFAGNAVVAVLTDSSGIATAPLLTPNNSVGPYLVTATTTISAVSCTFSLTN